MKATIIFAGMLSIASLMTACKKDKDEAEATPVINAVGYFKGTVKLSPTETVNSFLLVRDNHTAKFYSSSTSSQDTASMYKEDHTWQLTADTLRLTGSGIANPSMVFKLTAPTNNLSGRYYNAFYTNPTVDNAIYSRQ